MRLLITGVSGLVGSALGRLAAQKGQEVIGVFHDFRGVFDFRLQERIVDLADSQRLAELLANLHPEAIINAAAVSEPGQCEAEPKLAERLNVDLPIQLAGWCARHGARLVHFSSEQVFNGKSAPYSPPDPTQPLHLYGQQKVRSEQEVLATAPEQSVVVRLPLLLGNSLTEKRSVHERLLADWAAGRTTRLFTDELRQSCTADNVAALALALLAHPEICGIQHWAGAELLSRAEQGRRVRERFKLSAATAPIEEVTRAAWPALSARRPANLALEVGSLAEETLVAQESFDEALARLRLPSALAAWHARARER